MKFLLPVFLGLAVTTASAAEISIDATSRAVANGDDEITDNTSFAFSQCAATQDKRLLLRLKLTAKSNRNEPGGEGHVQLDAFAAEGAPLAAPLYTISVEGSDARVRENCIFVVNRGLEEVDWYDLYSLRSGALLFETMTEPLFFQIDVGGHIQEPDIAGFYDPPDDETNKRLAQPDVVGLIGLAQEDKVQNLVLVTVADKELAARLRSYWDERRYSAVVDAKSGALIGKATPEKTLAQRPLALEIYWAVENLRLRVPVTAKGLAIAKATLPKGFRLQALSIPSR